ncbi:hypothetical protein NHX12_030979 [Muraenolepis orangiensis]|uniref:Uncharacterized protein n=1 Tax=Muraenolepis orangiensis TaxID=630683 RepID=A0A9Q0IJV9_9TELE|nr:hypothetical protein NHX12_030979 [Muraenolepis orangiensis]
MNYVLLCALPPLRFSDCSYTCHQECESHVQLDCNQKDKRAQEKETPLPRGNCPIATKHKLTSPWAPTLSYHLDDHLAAFPLLLLLLLLLLVVPREPRPIGEMLPDAGSNTAAAPPPSPVSPGHPV